MAGGGRTVIVLKLGLQTHQVNVGKVSIQTVLLQMVAQRQKPGKERNEENERDRENTHQPQSSLR